MGKLSAAQLKRTLSYDPDTGVFTRLSCLHKRYVGRPAGTVSSQGYINIHFAGRPRRAHRLAWLYMTGEWPAMLDHVNGNRADNRFCNLRKATLFQNAQNSRGRGAVSGLKGAHKAMRAGGRIKWNSLIKVKGKSVYLGTFDTPEEAHAAYVAGARRLHGEFARPE